MKFQLINFFISFQESETKNERLSLPEKLGFITSPKAQELKEPVARPKIEPVSQTFDLFRPVYFCNNSVYNCQFLEGFANLDFYYPVVN